jgi:SSS family solute:Na+ symporter
LRTYADINFLHFAVLLFAICAVILVVVSLLTPAPPAEKVAGLTFGARVAAPADEQSRRWRRGDLLLSIGLALGVLVIWLYFS